MGSAYMQVDASVRGRPLMESTVGSRLVAFSLFSFRLVESTHE